MSEEQIVMFLATLSTTLIAGLMFGYSVSVNGGLGKLKDIEYLRAMQNINEVIQNPIFLLTFMGALLLQLVGLFTFSGDLNSVKYSYLISAFLLYAFGQIFVTIVRNVQLNNFLEKIDLDSATETELNQIRNTYEKPWNRWHFIRTVATILSSSFLILALIS